MKQENHPKEVRQNNKGANRDIDIEVVGANSKSGEYVDGRNLRVSSVRSQRQSAEKIRGEESIHSNALSGSYLNICVSSVNNKKVEFWVDKNGVEDPVIIIDGVIVAKSPNIPFLAEFPIQHDKNESCIGGEIFVTDNNSPPMTFNIDDMISSLVTNPTKYFQDFNPLLYTVGLDAPLNIPIFKELVNVGGSNGLPVGSYVYSIRYVNNDGDRTDWTPSTPPIPVLENVNFNSTTFPGVKTFGGPTNVNDNTNYGIKLKFRVNNSVNFDFIEIRRQDYNQGVPLITPDSNIVAKIDVSDGEISVREFIDPVDSNVFDAIPEDEEISRLASISRAKAIRYHDKQLVLMNVGFNSQSSDDIDFIEINGDAAVPVLKNLGSIGYKDPYNHVYNKRNLGGEKYGYGVALFGGLGVSSFVKPITGFENYQFPNRRDEVSVDSNNLSYRGTPVAANSLGVVSNVFEAFSHDNAVKKTDRCTFKNILNNGSRPRILVNSTGCPDTGQGSTVHAKYVLYNPYTPVSNSDNNVSGLNYRVNYAVNIGIENYEPEAFAPDYYSMGIALGGLDNIPAGVKGFSVVRTEPAKRIVAQGIGTYALTQGSVEKDFFGEITTGVTTKALDKMWFHSADLKNLSQSEIDDITNNPDDYQVQLVSPLGFFSEVYHHHTKPGSTNDRIIDMISYARILNDQGQINTGEQPTMGVGSGGKRYVSHNRYRNFESASGGAFSGDGNKLFSLNSLSEKSDGDSSYFEIQFNEDIYNFAGGSGLDAGDFDSPIAQSFHEPFYIINIINTGAEVRDLNINNYKGTGHFQKIESVIGISDGSPDQEFELVDERWEDCIPDIDPSGPFSSFNSYVYTVDEFGASKAWINVDFMSSAQITAISNNIIANGFHVPEPGVQVYGMYRSTNLKDRDFTIIFDIAPYYPEVDDTIVVRYDKRRPVGVYGGDSVVAENVFAPISRDIGDDYNEDNPENQFVLNIPFPFRNYHMNPRHYTPDGIQITSPLLSVNAVEQGITCKLAFVRQMLIMFAGESRSAVNFFHNTPETPEEQSFPLINYVMRPSAGIGSIINIFGEEYVEDYGAQETSILTKGGFRFNQQVNVDYQFDGLIEFFSKPKFGFEEKTEFCTAVIWSLPRAINQQDSPGLKTFLSTNRLDIADDQGDIKKAWDATTGGKGENLYAITDKGVCLLLTKKSILSNIDSDDLSTTASDQFISGQYWLSKDIGSSDEMWRGMGEGTIGVTSEVGNIEKEVLYFPNKQSVYSLIDNRLTDIGRNDYYSRLNPFLKGLSSGYDGHLAGFINKNNNEYWLEIEGEDSRELFVFGSENNRWEGSFDYRFDNYYMSSDKIFGVRDLETFELEKGFLINGDNIEYELLTAFAPGSAALEKEFIRFGVQSGERSEMKPSRVEFYDKNETLLCALNTGTQGPLYLKQYDGWEQFIGRKDASASSTRDRVQGRTIIVKIIHDKPEDFKIVTTTIQYKILK